MKQKIVAATTFYITYSYVQGGFAKMSDLEGQKTSFRVKNPVFGLKSPFFGQKPSFYVKKITF